MAARHYSSKSFVHLLGMQGFSNKLLESHFKLYEGYVKNTNQLSEFFASSQISEENTDHEFSESKRRFGWEFNGMRLHEYYFANMGKEAIPIDSAGELFEEIAENFGSYKNWLKEFVHIGSMRGIGWAILTYDTCSDRLFNVWINEHDLGLLAGTQPLLVMDVFEHAFMTDYGLERDKYISAFLKAIDWAQVGQRFDIAKMMKPGVFI
jgi:Fe-Mn family superoxide dismutase